ncbi:MAG: RagB/SusD family nutrient uptake outer membrane protein [Alistipes sp.]|nr:RagB/SusD family nutrient uptake outer membrane protein [Alistipes sp.]
MKLNKILKTTAVVLIAAVSFTGCIKEVFPKESAITESQLSQSDAGLESLLKSVPSAMAATVAASYDHSDFGYHSIGLYKDHHALTMFPCTRVDRGGNVYYSRLQAPNYGFDMGTNGGYTHYIWYNYYPYIKKANDIIGAVGTDESLMEYRGIAKAFRALFYIDLVGYYDSLEAKAPMLPTYEADLLKVKDYIVPIVTENTTEATAKLNQRAKREEMFEFIFADLKDAEECFLAYEAEDSKLKPTVYGSSVTYPELAAVYGLYARAYLWLGGFNNLNYENVATGEEAYRLAAEYARKAIDTANVSIMSEMEWTNTTTGFNSVVPAWIWATQMSTDTVINNLYAFPAHVCPEASYGYGPLACVGVASKTYDRLSNSDFRKKLIIGPNTTYADFKNYTTMPQDEWEELAYRAPYTNFKFRPAQGERVDYMVANAVSLPIMRIEEMYFIEMEAIAHYDEGTARTLLNTFMANRASNYVILPTEDVVDEIIFQKSVEFWGEGKVLFDMKRLNMGVDTTGQNYPSGMLFKSEGRLPWWNLPIPSGETAVNTACKETAGPDPSRGLVSEDAI